MDEQSTRIDRLPGGIIEDDILFEKELYEQGQYEPEYEQQQKQHEQPTYKQVTVADKKVKSFIEEDLILLVVLLWIRTLPITDSLTMELPVIGGYIRNNSLLTTLISCVLLALVYIIGKRFLN